MCRCYYLDSRNENGSDTILSELNIQINSINNEAISDPICYLNNNRLNDICKEKKFITHSVTYQAGDDSGDFNIDIRDSADCWLRIILFRCELITLPIGLYHRISTETTNSVPYMVSNISDNNIEFRYPDSKDSLHNLPVPHTFRELTCELCKQFYECGWVTGTGGSISIRYGNRIYMTPSGVQKERISPDDVFMLDISGKILSFPQQKVANKIPKLTDCSPLFFHAYRQRQAGAVIHSHDMTCVLAAALFPNSSEYRIARQEMIKGIAGHGYLDELVIPIIENTPKENELADTLGEAIEKYPRTVAVLVRDHGIYVWGDSWEAAKRHAECLHYLFDISIQMYKVGIHGVKPTASLCVCCSEQSTSSNSALNTGSSSSCGDSTVHSALGMKDEDGISRKRKLIPEEHSDDVEIWKGSASGVLKSTASGVKYVLLDIEGTTTPITFVKDVLFPYSSKHVSQFLHSRQDDEDVQKLMIDILTLKYEESHGQFLLPRIYSGNTNFSLPVEEVVTYVKELIKLDKKVPALKQLQGLIWKTGYSSGELKGVVYDDIPRFLKRMQTSDVSVCIYSSGSRSAQQLLFQHTHHGDLRPFIRAYFDTAVGSKQESSSYEDILLTLGSKETAGDVVFVTDIYEEAVAARKSGMRVIISVRPGNAALPQDHGFPVITSFDELTIE